MKITFLFPKNYKHGLLGDEFYIETIEFSEEIDLYKRFDFRTFFNEMFKRTSIWNKLNHFSFKPYLEWKRIFRDDLLDGKGGDGGDLEGGDLDHYILKAISLIKIIYKNHELNYLHNPIVKEIIFDFYLIYGITLKKTGLYDSYDSLNDPFNNLSGDYCIDISDFEKISENQDIPSIENPFHI